MNALFLDASDARREALGELVDVATQAANPQIDALTNRIADALQRAATGGAPSEAPICQRAADLLRKNRYPFYYVVAARLAALLEREAGLGDGGLEPPAPLAADLEVDKKLCLIKASQALEHEHAERLGSLNLRLAALLGRDTLGTADNPFRPQVFLEALHEAWCEFQPDAGAHHLLYPLLGSTLGFDMGPILHALNNALARRGVSLNVAAPAAAAKTGVAAPADNDPLLQKLRRLFPTQEPQTSGRAPTGAFPSLFQDEVLQTTRSRHELLNLLTRMQGRLASLLPADIRREAPDAELSRADDAALALVARIFAIIRSNPHLAEPMKAAILSLHLPVLKAVLGDHDFFFRDSHPVRRTIELLVRLALGWDRRMGETDPVYPVFRRSVARIVADADTHIGVFAEVATELEAFAKRDQTATEQALAQPIAGALKKEKRLQAQRAARHEVALRIGTGEVAAFVETFLEDKWVSVLTLAYVARDEKPHAVESALRTMDELVWSVKPKITAEERKELLSRLPPMIAMLNKWLDAIKWTDESRVRFFTELAKCHASLVRAPLEVSPQRQVELAVEAAQKAAERRELRRMQQQPEPAPDAFDDMVSRLQSGAWLAFRQEGEGVVKLKLAWISPMRNLYLFATRDRKEAMTLEAPQLAQTLREQKAQVVPAAGLVGHALAEALNEDGGALAAA
ncbi:DUF1631 family protein [Noviherbaspirillum aridicola]|uniref:Thymidine phosphorylase n=1 Tax=Noviherbaspirillum aridicola TaxID=2849687 RepID=A0ABQ4Q793_9BURK|nr:DUF1631 family protein [Noviherbaspirillum aridicola]GIZ53101.1 hypothetical protein NCCP691_31150 [Noviherbaspirillum aridicola]